MSPSLRIKYLSLPPWNWDGAVIAGPWTSYIRWVKGREDVDLSQMEPPAGHSLVADGRPWLLWVESRTNFPVLAHEGLHIVSGVLQARGMQHTDASEEAYAYTLTALLKDATSSKGWTVLR